MRWRSGRRSATNCFRTPRENCTCNGRRAPQTNGVVTTLRATIDTLTRMGHEVRVISPKACSASRRRVTRRSGWPFGPGRTSREMKAFRPHAIHIATEGPLGFGVALLPPSPRTVYYVLPHALSGIPARPLAHTPRCELRVAASLPGASARTFVSSGSLDRSSPSGASSTCTCGAVAWI